MKINISELFKYHQYIDTPIYYCFDKKEYKVRDFCDREMEDNTPYQRYISLLQIDEKTIQDHYIQSLNDRHISREYLDTNLCFNAFVEHQCLQTDWWRYYMKTVFDLEKIWCEENNIKYLYDL